MSTEIIYANRKYTATDGGLIYPIGTLRTTIKYSIFTGVTEVEYHVANIKYTYTYDNGEIEVKLNNSWIDLVDWKSQKF
jgi:hypothetical protein